MKFKPVYTVYLDEQVIGYVENKNEFEKLLEQNLYNNFDENIAFSDINAEVKYESKLINKEEETQEEQILLAIKEKSDITYFQYAVNVDGVDREYVKNEEELIERYKVQLEIYKKALEEALMKKVSETYIYSIHLCREIKIEI